MLPFLVDLRSRLAVMFDWFWSYLTYKRSMRLITGAEAAATEGELIVSVLGCAAAANTRYAFSFLNAALDRCMHTLHHHAVASM